MVSTANGYFHSESSGVDVVCLLLRVLLRGASTPGRDPSFLSRDRDSANVDIAFVEMRSCCNAIFHRDRPKGLFLYIHMFTDEGGDLGWFSDLL